MPSDEKNPLEIIEEKELKENVLTAIHGLPENQRIVTTLFYINGYSQNENDQTPLHRAAYRGHKAIVELLIEKGA
ncbi:TPA: hypothetical protein EYP66_00850, partial [Candidatus Poribacteria bacterium]|nr:hypothetical protein [Candidatus Poribacteria bacterium]